MESQESVQFPEEPGEESRAGAISLKIACVFGVILPFIIGMVFLAAIYQDFEGDGTAEWLGKTLWVLVGIMFSGNAVGVILGIVNLFEELTKKWMGQVGLAINGFWLFGSALLWGIDKLLNYA